MIWVLTKLSGTGLTLGDGRLGAVGVDGAVAPQSLGRQGSRNPKNFRGVGGRGRSHGTCGVPDLRNKMRGVPDGYVEGVGLKKRIFG